MGQSDLPEVATDKSAGSAWPPEGWLTNRQTAERLGVSLNTLTCNAWKRRATLRDAAKTVRQPGGGRCNLYPAELIGRLAGEREAAAEGPVIPDGYVDTDGACAMFGIGRSVWKHWVQQGRVRIGHEVPAAKGGRRKLYAVPELERLREELFGADKLYKSADNEWHVPAGFMRRDEAWETLGVSKPVWERWEREGKITCGQRVPSGPKLYREADIHRLLEEYGRWAPPYPDPERPGAYRVPLSGRDIRRHEAIIDADALPLIEGGTCSWSMTDAWGCVSVTRGALTSTSLRRLVMGIEDPAINVRHVNGDPLDCRRANLVVRTAQQRVRNARKVRAIKGQAPSSRFKGVSWITRLKRWQASIHPNRQRKDLGRFRDEIAAAKAYDEAARELFGEHARLNFPNGVDAWIQQYMQEQNDPREAGSADVPAGPVESGKAVEPIEAMEAIEPIEPARWRKTELDLAA